MAGWPSHFYQIGHDLHPNTRMGSCLPQQRSPQQIPSIDRPGLTGQRRPSSAGLAETVVVEFGTEFGTVPTAPRQVSCARVSGALKISVHAGKRRGEPGRAHRA